MMTKQEHWEKTCEKYKHLKTYCIRIEAKGIEDETIYYHPHFYLDETHYVSAQADIEKLPHLALYATRYISQEGERYSSVDIPVEIMDAVVMGFTMNKEIVEVALDILSRLEDYLEKVKAYVNDYTMSLLVGNSATEITRQIISDLQATNKLIEMMQKNRKE